MSQDLKARLEAAKAARAVLKAKAAEVDESKALADELEDEERSLKEETALDALTDEHGAKKLAKVDTALGAVILLRPHPAAFKRFQEQPEFKIEHAEQYVRPSVKYPTLAEFDVLSKEQPGILIACANALNHLAGLRKDQLSGK